MKLRSPAARGFTLVELMIAFSLAMVAMAALLACFVFLARNFTRLANYRALEQQGRTAVAALQADLGAALGVKSDSTPTAASLTLVLPDGTVTYTYDAAGERLRRQADFGANPDRDLLKGPGCRCASLAFSYFTASGGSPAAQLAPATNTPLSIQQVQVAFTLQTPATEASQTQQTFAGGTARLHLRNKRKPDGS